MNDAKIVNVTHVEMTPLLFGAKDAAKLLGIGERTLWELTSEGKLPIVKVKNRTLWPGADLQRWVDANKLFRPASTAAGD